MKALAITLLASCATLAPSSVPTPAPASAPTLPLPAPSGDTYDEQAMREVVAGCDRLLGDERGRTSACNVRVRALLERVAELTDVARKLNLWSWLAPLLSGGLGLVLGGVLGIAGAVLGAPR